MNCISCQIPLRFFLHKKGYDIFECPSCAIKQTDLKEPYDEFVTRLYDEGYFTGNKDRNAYTSYLNDKPYILKNLQQFLREIHKHKRKGSLLDVGCAMGFFVELAMHNGFDAYGIDPSLYAVTYAKNLVGAKRIAHGTLNNHSFSHNTFDIITLFDVFEHVGDPSSILESIYKLLKPNGIVVIATGDTSSIFARILKKHWTFYIPPQHLFFFNKNNATRILETHGFSLVECTRIGKWFSLEYVLHLAETAAMLPFFVQLQRVAKQFHIERLPLYLPIQDNMLLIAKKTA